jgi:hypothetical protein
MAAGVEAHAPTVMNAGYPMVLCGVQRKINTGNFENIDVYCAVSIPLFCLPDDAETFFAAVRAAAELGFTLSSQETGERYNVVKNMQREGRQA